MSTTGISGREQRAALFEPLERTRGRCASTLPKSGVVSGEARAITTAAALATDDSRQPRPGRLLIEGAVSGPRLAGDAVALAEQAEHRPVGVVRVFERLLDGL